jgi:asparagine synthase (glutamine-hydrolysing)
MCGITGYLDFERATPETELVHTITAMTNTLATRGPDAHGIWTDASSGIALGHRRLAILDCSTAAVQPMVSANGRYVLVYNGEIFNFREIGAELARAGVALRTRSDTEVLLEACALWGVSSTISRCIGMFAFALWDRKACTLELVRDRIGIKPLYWGIQGRLLWFASQPRALLAHPAWQGKLNPVALSALLQQGYIPTPLSIYQGVQTLRPGHQVTIRADGSHSTLCYWNLPMQIGAIKPFPGTSAEAADQLDQLLRDAVQRRMVADVPLGVFLSGGIDSSMVTALMQAQSPVPIRSFSIGFHEASHDESCYAQAVSNYLGTDHTALMLTAGDAQDRIASLAEVFDEPFADVSQLPTLLLSQLTRQHVTVALSGDGGDELFAGYTRYQLARQLQQVFRWTPTLVRRGMASGLRKLSPESWDRLAGYLPAGRRPALLGDKVHKLAHVFDLPHVEDLYPQLLSFWPLGQPLVQGTVPWQHPDTSRLPVLDGVARMQLLDTLGYLPDDLLVKVDRASMAFGLEARVPLLDHRVVEFAWSLPMKFKLQRGQSKWLLRQVLGRAVRICPGRCGSAPRGADSPALAGTSQWPAQLAIRPLGRADVSGMAAALDVGFISLIPPVIARGDAVVVPRRVLVPASRVAGMPRPVDKFRDSRFPADRQH